MCTYSTSKMVAGYFSETLVRDITFTKTNLQYRFMMKGSRLLIAVSRFLNHVCFYTWLERNEVGVVPDPPGER